MSNYLNNLFSLEGQVAVVIGGTGELCGAMAEGLAQAGAEVVLVGRSQEKAELRMASIAEHGGGQVADDSPETVLGSSSSAVEDNIVDFKSAEKNVPGGEKILRELGGLFLGECPRLLGELVAAVGESDVTTAQRAAHTLKSNATIFAATPLADIAAKIEKFAARKRLGDVERLVPGIELAGERVCQAIRDWLKD